MTSTFYVDGHFVPSEEAFVPVSDLAVLRGYGVFDFLRTYHGRPLTLRQNAERLLYSADLIDLNHSYTTDEIVDIVRETLARNEHTESNIRMVLTGGDSRDFFIPVDEPRLLVMVTPSLSNPAEWYEEGVKVITVPHIRNMPLAKTINYTPAIIAIKQAHQRDALEAIYVNEQGIISEGTRSNLFLFQGDTLVTPGEDVLSGITRKMLLVLAQSRYTVDVRDVTLDELLGADEVFFTAASKRVVPVRQVDEQVIGDGRPGVRTQLMMQLFDEATFGVAT